MRLDEDIHIPRSTSILRFSNSGRDVSQQLVANRFTSYPATASKSSGAPRDSLRCAIGSFRRGGNVIRFWPPGQPLQKRIFSRPSAPSALGLWAPRTARSGVPTTSSERVRKHAPQ